MININTLEILQGPVAQSVMQSSHTTRVVFWVLFIIIILVVGAGCEGNEGIGCITIIVLIAILVIGTWLVTGYSYKDFKSSSYRTLVAEIDTESEQFKETFKTTENLEHMIKTFPETEQKQLDTKIVNKNGKYYFTNTVTKQYVDEIANKTSLERKMETNLKVHYNKMNIYTQNLEEDKTTQDKITQKENLEEDKTPQNETTQKAQ